MGRGGAANLAINAFNGACSKVPYLTSGPVAHATGLVGQWTTIQNCLQFLVIMHRRNRYQDGSTKAAKQHLVRHLPEDIEDLELVVRPIRKALRSMHYLNAKHLANISGKVAFIIGHLIKKKNYASTQGFGDWVHEALAGGARKAHRYTTKDTVLP